ncbi:MAG: hypothetical protein ACOY5Y_16555 [Pseudomonadota bacterium]
MFEPDPKAKADMKPGTLYAVAGEDGWLYYGQVTPEKAVAFFRHRGRELDGPQAVLSTPVMCVVPVAYPSITRALRAGSWMKLGRHPLGDGVAEPQLSVQWPVGASTVTVWSGGEAKFDTRVDDPAIQDAELMAVWDAQHHIPARLTADFSPEEAEWHVGGPMWRERRVKEEMAKRSPDQPWHQLPLGWVPTSVR